MQNKINPKELIAGLSVMQYLDLDSDDSSSLWVNKTIDALDIRYISKFIIHNYRPIPLTKEMVKSLNYGFEIQLSQQGGVSLTFGKTIIHLPHIQCVHQLQLLLIGLGKEWKGDY